MSWVYLLLAGLSEILWATTMKLSQGFTKVGWVIVTIIGLIASMAFLIQAVKQLPFSLAYPIWTGIGAVGSVVMGVVLFVGGGALAIGTTTYALWPQASPTSAGLAVSGAF